MSIGASRHISCWPSVINDCRRQAQRLSKLYPPTSNNIQVSNIQADGIVANGKSSLAYPRGPCLYEHIPGNTWTHALHATRFNCLTLPLYPLEVGWSFYPFVLFLWPIACVYA